METRLLILSQQYKILDSRSSVLRRWSSLGLHWSISWWLVSTWSCSLRMRIVSRHRSVRYFTLSLDSFSWIFREWHIRYFSRPPSKIALLVSLQYDDGHRFSEDFSGMIRFSVDFSPIWLDFSKCLSSGLRSSCSHGDSSDSFSQEEMKKSRKKPKIESSMGHSHSSSWDSCDSGESSYRRVILQDRSLLSLENSSPLRSSLLDQLLYFFSSGEATTISRRVVKKSAPRRGNRSSPIPSSRASSSSLPIAFSRILSISNFRIMKKIILIIVLVLAHSFLGIAFAADASTETTVILTEEIPWGNCRCIEVVRWNNRSADTNGSCSDPATRKYSCTVKTGLAGFEATFAAIVKYVVYIVMLLGVLGIVGLGIAWMFAGGDDIKMKASLKKWGVNVLIGLTLLFMFGSILKFIAPWIYTG